MPVASFGKLLFDDITDQQDLASAQQVRDHEGGQRRDKYHGDTADDARDTERQPDIEQSLEKVCAQILCCVDGVVINLAKHIINRKNHKRQEVVYHR